MSVENIMSYVNLQHSAPALKTYEFTNPQEINIEQHREAPRDLVSTCQLMIRKNDYDKIYKNDQQIEQEKQAQADHEKLVEQINVLMNKQN